MKEKSKHATTFESSCLHWSEQRRAEMDAFYQLATYDYYLLAKELNWPDLFHTVNQEFGESSNILDVACGSGKFPGALLDHSKLLNCQNLRIDYSLLDPSEFSIREAKSVLRDPFIPSNEYVTTIQDLNCNTEHSVVWATHALYSVPEKEIPEAIDKMISTLHEKGLGFIAHASKNSHYLEFYNQYLNGLGINKEPFSAAEQIVQCLKDSHPDMPVTMWSIEYEGKVDENDRITLEGYLQRCLFDSSLSLDYMLNNPKLGSYLFQCHDEQQRIWRFPQKVWLIFFGELAKKVKNWKWI